jgi:hypothetical protein
LILDIDASLLIAHSEKEGAAGNYKGGFGFHPLLCYLAETGEPLAALLRPGNAAAHTVADHFELLQLALQQLLESDLGREILARADIGGRTHAFTQNCRDAGIRFSVGYEVDERVRGAITELPESADVAALELRHAAGPASRTRSGSARRPGCARCPSPPSPTTRPGWRSRCWRRRCCAGRRCSAWMEGSRSPSPSGGEPIATGSPPGPNAIRCTRRSRPARERRRGADSSARSYLPQVAASHLAG